MDDREILARFAARDESALRILEAQFGDRCREEACRLLGSEQDAEEIVNDALHNLWNAIPPAEPDHLQSYLLRTVRNLCVQRLRTRNAAKRGGGLKELSLDDSGMAAVSAPDSVESALDHALLTEAINRFLRTVSADARTVFVARYGNDRSVAEIAEAFGISQGSVLVSLMRTRKKLWRALKKEGWL
jgi:RNA polymerase sigma-70 factor (ECF subfamily)